MIQVLNDLETVEEFITDLDPEDVSLDVCYTLNEVLKKLPSLNINFAKNPSTDRLNTALICKLRQNHPNHQYFNSISGKVWNDIIRQDRVNLTRKCFRLHKYPKQPQNGRNLFLAVHFDIYRAKESEITPKCSKFLMQLHLSDNVQD